MPSRMDVGRPVIIPSICSNEYNDHQTRYLASLATFEVLSLVLLRLIPRVTAERTDRDAILQDLDTISHQNAQQSLGGI